MNKITVKVSFEPENGTISTGSTERTVCDIIRAQITDRNFDYGMKIKDDFESAKRIGLSDVHTKITVTDVVSMTNRIPFITFMRMPKSRKSQSMLRLHHMEWTILTFSDASPMLHI